MALTWSLRMTARRMPAFEVNPLLTEEAHQAIEDLKNFPRSPYTDKATWWYVVKGIHV